MERVQRKPTWQRPEGSGEFKGLRVLNSLTGQKEEFVPREGNRVGWYICGPTVYDSSHFGHARCYVTFDVLRRILEDYFHYEVFAVMNITDVDDKIILKARRTHLLGEYLRTHGGQPVAGGVLDDLVAGYDLYEQGLRKKVEAFPEAEVRKRNPEYVLLADRLALVSTQRAELAAAQTGPRVLSEWLADSAHGGQHAEVLSLIEDQRHGSTVTESGIFRAHAQRYEKEFLEDLDDLGVRMPDAVTRVTEYVPEVVSMVQTILANGFAYEANGSVYFDTARFDADPTHFYAKLEPASFGNAKLNAEGEGELFSNTGSEKRSPNDFALWKCSKAGEPRWPFPGIGEGRPGWHIECSAMAGALLGQALDVHAGGIDLRFPHHDNEMAQSEACFGCPQWVNYFVHSGHLHINGLKMAKSLKNFRTIREVRRTVSPRQIRLYFVQYLWYAPVDFTDDGIAQVRDLERVFLRFLETVAALHLRSRADMGTDAVQRWTPAERDLQTALWAQQDAVHAAFCNNFDTPAVLVALRSLVSAANSYMDRGSLPRTLLLVRVAAYVLKTLAILGVTFPEFPSLGGSGSSASLDRAEASLLPAVLDSVAAFRSSVRSLARSNEPTAAILAACDDLRDRVLPPLGVRLEDDGKTLWTRADPAALMAELDEKRRAAEAKALEKRRKRAEFLTASVARQRKAAVPPQRLFVDDYPGWTLDDKGLPLTGPDGAELPESKRKNLAKLLAKQTLDHSKFLAAGGVDALRALEDELLSLQQ